MRTCKAPWSEAERSQRLTSAFAAAIVLNAELYAHSRKLRFLKKQARALKWEYNTLPEHATTPAQDTRADFSRELRSIWLAKDEERRTDLLPWCVAWRKHQREFRSARGKM
jgi:hypothetical protein